MESKANKKYKVLFVLYNLIYIHLCGEWTKTNEMNVKCLCCGNVAGLSHP